MRLKGYSLLLLAATFFALPASAQQRQIERATLAPDLETERTHFTSPVYVRAQVEEGFTYGHHNKPGGENAPPDHDVFGYFDPTDPFTAFESEPYGAANNSFAGTIAGDGLLYYMLQVEGAEKDTLGTYDFDTQTIGPHRAITVYDQGGVEMDAVSIPQWVDAGINTETGNIILLARAGACTTETGGALWELDLNTLEAHFMLQFTDVDNCPLSGAYDNENNRFVGMVPDAGFEGFYQADLTTGETVGTIPLPGDMNENAVAQFIQSGATDYKLNDDPSDNAMWIFLFEGVNPNIISTARQITFDGDGIINGQVNYGEINDEFAYVEVTTAGFPNIAPAPNVSTEQGALPRTFEFVGVYPNPFRSAATVMLRSDEPAENVSVRVYDVLGREVAVLHDGPLSASTHHFGLEASNLPVGMYLVSVRSGDFSQTQKVVLVD